MNTRPHSWGITLTVVGMAGIALTAVVGAAAKAIPVRALWGVPETGSSCSCGPL